MMKKSTIKFILIISILLFPPTLFAKDIWFGTAPFCKTKPSDCAKRGMIYIKSNKRGDGKKCLTGRKVLCRQKTVAPEPRVPGQKWFGSAPFCGGKKSDCSKRGMTFVRYSKRGNGKSCVSGRKVLCKPANQRKGKYQKWLGTAPICKTKPSDCSKYGMKYLRSNKRGNGKKCFTGTKVLCEGDKNAPSIKWIGTSPICKGKASDCESFDMDYIGKSRSGIGKRCLSGFKVKCRARNIRKYNSRGANASQLYILDANIFSRPFIAGHDGQKERMAHIPRKFSEIANGKVDVIVFEENFQKSKRFQKELRQAGFKYFSTRLKPRAPIKGISDGGVLIVSRWPIVNQDKHVYVACNRKFEDCLAAKGVIYAKIKKTIKGKVRYYHIFGTHFQAWNTQKDKKARLKQAKELRKFIKRMRIPTNQAVIIAGDFNTDLINNRTESNKILQTLNVTLPRFANNNRASSEPQSNQLVGSDGSSKKCSKKYKRTKKCVCCKNQFLDYITYSKNNLKPISSSIKILKIKTKIPFSVCMSAKLQPNYVSANSPFCGRTWKIRDLADHYPVLGVFKFK